tara:strand:+ start:940 stop:1113 length:174 start_codon:yes stop_codon:yes gene_type:complete
MSKFDHYGRLINRGGEIDKHLDWLYCSNPKIDNPRTIQSRQRKLKKLVEELYAAVVE